MNVLVMCSAVLPGSLGTNVLLTCDTARHVSSTNVLLTCDTARHVHRLFCNGTAVEMLMIPMNQ